MKKRLRTKEDAIWSFGEYLGEHFGYQLYRAADGNIEGYKSVDGATLSTAREIKRVVTTTSLIDEFPIFLPKSKSTTKKYNPYKDPKQYKIE